MALSVGVAVVCERCEATVAVTFTPDDAAAIIARPHLRHLPGGDRQVSAPADWLARLGLGDVTILALIPNTVMDRLSVEDCERLCGLLAQEHAYHQHRGDPVADWNAARTRDEINRLRNP